MSKTTKTSRSESAGLSPQKLRWVIVGAMLAAALPHFFLNMPVEFYKQGVMRGWLGLSIWGPSFLAAVALFLGVDTSAQRTNPLLRAPQWRAAAQAVTPILVTLLLCVRYFDGYQRVGRWSELGLAMVLYAGTFALGSLFWQGLVQKGAWQMGQRGVAARLGVALLVAAAAGALWLPFLTQYSFTQVRESLDGLLIVYLGLSLLFEAGVSVYGCMLAAALMGAGWAWAHQMIFY